MVNKILKDFIEHNDKLVKEWMNNPLGYCENDVYFRQGCKLSMYGMPEPYLGDPFHCSAVIVNINPGRVMKKHNCWCTKEESSNFINKYLMSGQSYKDYALKFPYLTLPEGERGTNWWESRNNWIKNFYSQEDLRPFAIELCPWHSDKWKGMKCDNEELKAYIDQYIIKPAGEAIKNSELPFGLGVGKPIINALEELGFQKKEWTWESPTLEHWPVSAKGAIKRVYAFLYHKDSDVSFLCTCARGGNKAPSDKFRKVEMVICEIIKNEYLKVSSNLIQFESE